jgi:hypothetical protein
MRRLALLALVAGVGCGGGRPPAAPTPQSVTTALAEFMAAVKANDLRRMGALWGTERGPATGWMKDDQLRMRLTVIQRYLMHVGYRVVEGPLSPPGSPSPMTTVRIELQRPRCNVVLPIDLVRARGGGWLVYDVHLESAGNPAAACGPGGPGTRR